MGSPFTLFDVIYRDAFSKKSFIAPEWASKLQQARRFVLDTEMSGFLADLSLACYAGKEEAARVAVAEQVRPLARNPHKIVWVEMDNIARGRRVQEYAEMQKTGVSFYGKRNVTKEMAPDRMPRLGWLIEQYSETIFKVAIFTDMEGEGFVLPMSFAYSTESDVIPYKPIDAIFTSKATPATIACGLGDYDSPNVLLVEEPLSKTKPTADIIYEFIGELRWVWAFLSTINDIPFELREVKPSKGFVGRGQYRKFLSYNVVTLKVPQRKSLRKLALQIIKASRRRYHPVRGHWREDWRHLPVNMCDHVWKPMNEPGHLQCNHCAGRRVWIAEHWRGDKALGIVIHDYSVEKGDAA